MKGLSVQLFIMQKNVTMKFTEQNKMHPENLMSVFCLSLSLSLLVYLKYMCTCSISKISPSWARAGCKKILTLHYPGKIKFIHSFSFSCSLSSFSGSLTFEAKWESCGTDKDPNTQPVEMNTTF